jgi:predicted RNA polymerase sigma factor
VAADVHRTIDAIWRIESAKLIAGIARLVRDVGVAEDIAHDALVSALERWPQAGVPERPGAWLAAVARMRAIDVIRRNDRLRAKHEQIARDLDRPGADGDPAAIVQEEIADDLTPCCRPIHASRSRCASLAA